jgi:beta-glucosidase
VKNLKFWMCSLCAALIAPVVFAQSDTDIEKKIDKLLSQMTLEQKIGQMALRDWGTYSAEQIPAVKQAIREGKIGGFLNVNFSAVDDNAFAELQRIAVEESPQGIPLVFGQDVIHGYKTIFPIPLGQAASWNPELVETGARVSAKEATTDGIRWTFAPMIDISRDPRWGRIAESLGEDPYLTSELAVAMVKGFQGDDLTDPSTLAATGKHFVGYGAAEGGRDYNAAYLPEGLLRDVHLSPFKAIVDAGVVSLMSSYSTLNDVPVTGSKFIMTDILRDEWGFDGFVVSDWNAVMEMIPHGYAQDAKHAAQLAANAGIDFEMYTTTFEDHLAGLIKEGKFTEEQLDQAVRNMLRSKLRMGLWENPYPRGDGEKVILNEQFLAEAKKAAQQTFVLLKNDNNLLPLNKKQTVAVIGPLADAPFEQLGTWIYNGDKKDTRTLLPAIRELVGDKKVIYAQGLDYSRDKNTRGFKEALKAAKKADVILYIGGEEAVLSGEGHSRGDISLPGAQKELVAQLTATGKPLAVVLMAGRPIELGPLLQQADTIMMAWHPGTMGGPALAEVLYGNVSPSGRLPLTWPVAEGQIPIYYNHMNTGRPPSDDNYTRIDDIEVGVFQHQPGNSSNLLDYGHQPQFPFGYGLTYSKFDYSDLKLSRKTLPMGEAMEVSATIKNTGKATATEVVQLYVQDVVGDVTRPVRELKGFERITLAPGASQKVTFNIHTDDLAFHDQKMERVTEPGDFNVWVAPNAASGLKDSFVVK